MQKLMFLIIIAMISGCSEKSEKEMIATGYSKRVFKEYELIDKAGYVNHNDTVILHLESNIPHEGDTGTTGVDIVSYEFTHSVNQSICLEEHDEIDYMLEIKNEQNQTIETIRNGECKTIEISQGIYHFYLSKILEEGSLQSGSTVFIRPYAETTHCDNYKVSDKATMPPAMELKTPNRCTDDKYLACTVPASYKDLSADCPIEGPWTWSNYAECSLMTSDEAENCKNHFYKNCDKIASVCIDFWKENGRFSKYDSIWQKCFNGLVEQYSSTKYRALAESVMFENYYKYIEEFCKGPVVRDCNSKWNTDSLKPEKCSGFVKYIKYSDLDLKQGEAAIQQRSYMHIGRNDPDPQPEEIVMVINGRCDGVMRRTGSVIAGPYTQVVLYPYENLKGKPLLLENLTENPKEFQFPKKKRPFLMKGDPTYSAMMDSETASLAVMAVTGKPADLCRIKDAGIVCDPATQWDIQQPKLTGEVLLVKNVDESIITTAKNCSAAYLFDYRCDDLEKLGLKNYGDGASVSQLLNRVVLPDENSVLRSFSKTGFSGKVVVSQGSKDAVSTIYLDAETISSTHAYKLPDYNHAILISLRKCCGCDLQGIDFTGDDLSNTVLVGSNMKNTVFNNTNLTGSDLRKTSLVNAKFNSVKLGDNHFGCADLSNVDMSDPSDSSKSTAVVSGSFGWDINKNHNNIEVSCDQSETNLTSAKIPVQILPKNSWKTINLQKATLLDKVDGYDLSGIDLSDSNFTDLKAGGKVMNMQGANLSGSNLTNADFSSIDFSPLINDETAQYSNFSNTRIGGTSFANANLEGADFKKVSVDGISGSVNFSYALMMNTVLTDADLGRADFSNAYFFSKFRTNVTIQKKAKAENIIAQDSVFTGSFMSRMTFTNVTFKNSNFYGSQLVGAFFSSGDLSNSKFSDAYLHGADMTGVLLTDASFSGAYLSLEDGYWHYSSDDAECSEIRIDYKKTDLGDTSAVICPNGEKGPCDTDEKLRRKDKKTVEPQCVDGEEDIFGDIDCITHEYLEKNTIPKCDQDNEDVMQCGCLISKE